MAVGQQRQRGQGRGLHGAAGVVVVAAILGHGQPLEDVVERIHTVVTIAKSGRSGFERGAGDAEVPLFGAGGLGKLFRRVSKKRIALEVAPCGPRDVL